MADRRIFHRQLRRCGPVLLAILADMTQAATPLSPGQSLEREIAPDEVHEYRVELADGRAADLRLIQLEPLLKLTLSGPDGTVRGPLRTQSGRHGLIRLTLSAGDWLVQVAPYRPGVKYRLALSPLRSDLAGDTLRAGAERAFWNADAARRAYDPDSGEGSYRQAHEEYETAIAKWREVGDDCGLLLARTGLARLYFAAGKFIQARDAAEQALHHTCIVDGDLTHAAETAAAWRTVASSLGYLGELDAAAKAHRRALALYERTGDTRFQGVVSGNLAAVERERGATGAALDAATRSADLARRSNDPEGVVFALEAAASIRLARGELGPALQAYRETLDALAVTPYPMMAGQSWNNLGIIYARTGDFPAARRAFDRALAIWDQTGHRSGLGDTLIGLGGFLLNRGDRAAAEAAFRQALAIGEADRFLMTQAHAHLGLGRSALIADEAATAQRELLRALELARQANDANARAEAELLLGDLNAPPAPETAAAHYRRALALLRQTGDRWGQALVHASLARLAIATGEPAQGIAGIEQAVALIEDQRRRIFDPALRSRYFASQRDIFDLYIDLLLDSEQRPTGRNFGLKALEAAERARAAATRDHFAERRIDLETMLDPELVTAERAAEDAVRVLARRQAVAPDQVAESEMAAALRALDEARGRLRAAYPRYADLIRSEAPGVGEIQALLDEHSGLLELWLGPRRSMVWLVLPDAVYGYPAPARDELERLASELRGGILAPGQPVAAVPLAQREQWQKQQQAQAERSAGILGQALLGPLDSVLGTRRLVIVADGGLHAIPFGLLAPSGSPLWQRHEMVYLPSAGVLGELRALPAPAAPERVAVIADPVYSAADERWVRPAAGLLPNSDLRRAAGAAGVLRLERLTQADREARAIHALAPDKVQVYSGFAARRERLGEAAVQQAGIVHFAAHALLNTRHPELSGIVLSLFDPVTGAQDGFLRAADLYRMHFDGALIVLGACDSAFGPAPGAEGVHSLARAFQHAGARGVVASLWPVDDRAGAAFMAVFYRALLNDGLPAAGALRAAQRTLASHPRYRLPYYWSGFVLQGE